MAVSPAEMLPGAPTMVGASWGRGLQASARTHWSIPSITDSRSFGSRLGTPCHLAMGSSTLWNSMVGTGRPGWMPGSST